jgi:hypothetical protein
LKRAPGYLTLYFLAVAMPSAPVFQRYLGVGGAIAYVVAVGVVVALLPRMFPWLLKHISARAAIVLGVAALVSIIGVFAVAYPRLNTHVPGTGSDRDDALNVGVNEIVHGRYPYHAKTYLGAPISPGPGALMQSIPFWLLGNAAFQNFFWLPAFVIVASWLLRDVRVVIGMTLITIALCPALVGLEVMTGGDFFANSLYILTASMLLMLATRKGMAAILLASAVLGFLLSSRLLYGFIVPIVLAHVWRVSNWKHAIACATALVAALLAVSLPFYLYEPGKFGPLIAQNKFDEIQGVLPKANVIAVVTTALLAIGLAIWILKRGATIERVMAACAMVLIYPAALGMVLECIKEHRLNFNFAGWASGGTFFAMMAFAAVSAPATSAHRATASARCAADRPGCS